MSSPERKEGSTSCDYYANVLVRNNAGNLLHDELDWQVLSWRMAFSAKADEQDVEV